MDSGPLTYATQTMFEQPTGCARRLLKRFILFSKSKNRSIARFAGSGSVTLPVSQNNRLRVAVVGGGITGLTAAYALAQARRSGAPVDEVLFEARDRLGGVVHSERVEDFVVEAGPDSFLTEKPEARLLCEELGLGGELTGSNDAIRQTYILHRGRLTPLPDGLMFFVPVRPWSVMRSPLLPAASKVALVRELFLRPCR